MNSFLSPQVECFQRAEIWSHEGTWQPPFQPTRILQRSSNTTQRGKFQRHSHRFCNNYTFRSSAPLANRLNDAHPRINSQVFFATERTSSSEFHATILLKRYVGWLLLKCPRRFIHRLTVSKVGLKILQKSGLFSVATHRILPVLFSHVPQSYPLLAGSKWNNFQLWSKNPCAVLCLQKRNPVPPEDSQIQTLLTSDHEEQRTTSDLFLTS